MDPIKNPFSPGAGSPPPELVGREDILEQTRILLGRVRQGRAEKSILLTGLRGVGKTVLLNEMARMAERADYQTIFIEAHENKALAASLAPPLRELLYKLDRMEGAKENVRRGLAVLKSFLGALTMRYDELRFSLDVEPEKGSADSGDLEIDLPTLITVIAQAAQAKEAAVAILIDEIQYFDQTELSALIMAMHSLQQRQLPLILVGGGLPVLPRLAGESKSYAERLFHFPLIGALSEEDAKRALKDPVKEEGASFDEDAVDEIVRMTEGYPYFVQEWGYQAWNQAETSPITFEVIERVTRISKKRLDDNFFRVRFDRLTDSEKIFLRAMSEIEHGPIRTGEIAAVLGVKVTSLGPRRASLMKKGMIYSPVHGELAFTVPLFGDFMRRAIPDFQSKEK